VNPIVRPGASTLQQAASILRAGGVVAFPTETYYGLAADPFNEGAVDRLYQIKKRSGALPILLLIQGQPQLSLVARTIPPPYLPLINHFWPGPLSLIFPALEACSSRLTGGTGTVAVRHSPHPIADQLVRAFGGPITATSANISGAPAAINAEQVYSFFSRQVDLILDGGDTPGGQGSTLVGLKNGLICCFRAGKIDFSLVQSVSASYNQSIS